MDYRAEAQRWTELASDPAVAAELVELLASGDEARIEDAFFRTLEFGTGGLRGMLGPGTNRMNVYTVAQATQGLANYLLEHGGAGQCVAISRDSRNRGEEFVRTSAGVLAANGIKAYVYPRIEPTPALSFAVRDLHCAAGINITASHNPAEYNGYKAYGPDGCQITSGMAAGIQAAIDACDLFADVKCADFDEAMAAGSIEWIGEGTLDRFIEANRALAPVDGDSAQDCLSIVYTPLNGTGLECVTRILDAVGIRDIALVESQKDPNGDFPTCPYPNPEFREALEEGIALCRQVHPDLLLATDPDADRVGVAVADGEDYRLISGNEMGILLTDYIAHMRRQAHTMPEDALVVSTIVSTSMIDALAKRHGFTVVRTLTGFKYIGELIGELEAKGEEGRYIFGFEESYGYLSGTHVRDKDAVNASMLICLMARHYKHRGMSLAQATEALYAEYGYYRNRTVNAVFPGADGARRMTALMAQMRETAPAAIAGLPVQQVVDYAPGHDGLPKANVLEFRLPGEAKVIFRPSGTEPKIKAYLFARGETADEADALLDALESAAQALLA